MTNSTPHSCTLECFDNRGFPMALAMTVHACTYVGACPSCGDPVSRDTDHPTKYVPCGGVLLCPGCHVLEESDEATPGDWDYALGQSVQDILTRSRPQAARDRTLDALALVEAAQGGQVATAKSYWDTLDADERTEVSLTLAAWVGMMNELTPVPFSDWCDSVRAAALRST